MLGSMTFESLCTILHVGLYGGKTWSLTLREEHRLRMFENRVLRIFGPEKGSNRKLEETA